jgi:hypothetical protein
MYPVMRVLSGDELAYHPVQHAAQSFNSSDVYAIDPSSADVGSRLGAVRAVGRVDPKVRRPARPGSCPFLDCGSHLDR